MTEGVPSILAQQSKVSFSVRKINELFCSKEMQEWSWSFARRRQHLAASSLPSLRAGCASSHTCLKLSQRCQWSLQMLGCAWAAQLLQILLMLINAVSGLWETHSGHNRIGFAWQNFGSGWALWGWLLWLDAAAAHGDHGTSCAHAAHGDPQWNRDPHGGLHAGAGGCARRSLCPHGKPELAGSVTLTLEQSVPEDSTPWMGSYTGALSEDVQHRGRTHTGEDQGGMAPMGGTPLWSRGRVWVVPRRRKKRQRQRVMNCCRLRSPKIGSEVKPGRKEVVGMECFRT